MQTLKSLDVTTAQGRTKELFDSIEKRVGRVPAMIRVMGNSPSVLDAYLHFNEVLDQSNTTPQLRSLISALVSEINGCQYTLATSFAFGRRAGLSYDELNQARKAESSDPKIAAALQFAAKVVKNRGSVSAADVKALQAAGYNDQDVVEIVGLAALNTLRNYFNLVAGTEVDFPSAKANSSAPDASVKQSA